jgi:hypothetical protein
MAAKGGVSKSKDSSADEHDEVNFVSFIASWKVF